MKTIALKFLNLLKYSSLSGLLFGTTLGLNITGDMNVAYKNGFKKTYNLRTTAPMFTGIGFGIMFPLSIIILPFSLINYFIHPIYINKSIDNVLEQYTIETEKHYNYDENSKYGYPPSLFVKINKSETENENDKK